MAVRVLMVVAVFAVLSGCDRGGPTHEEQANGAGAERSEPAPGLSTQPLPAPEPAPEPVQAPPPVEPVEPAPEPPTVEPPPEPEPAPVPGRCPPPPPPYASDCGEE